MLINDVNQTIKELEKEMEKYTSRIRKGRKSNSKELLKIG